MRLRLHLDVITKGKRSDKVIHNGRWHISFKNLAVLVAARALITKDAHKSKNQNDPSTSCRLLSNNLEYLCGGYLQVECKIMPIKIL